MMRRKREPEERLAENNADTVASSSHAHQHLIASSSASSSSSSSCLYSSALHHLAPRFCVCLRATLQDCHFRPDHALRSTTFLPSLPSLLRSFPLSSHLLMGAILQVPFSTSSPSLLHLIFIFFDLQCLPRRPLCAPSALSSFIPIPFLQRNHRSVPFRIVSFPFLSFPLLSFPFLSSPFLPTNYQLLSAFTRPTIFHLPNFPTSQFHNHTFQNDYSFFRVASPPFSTFP